ncbi:hypothetical protein COL922a_011539 [Colletotrichum nupharicola]|nr:hypothetical protein COL922a_011539 [Colletotrichum nupharicola]
MLTNIYTTSVIDVSNSNWGLTMASAKPHNPPQLPPLFIATPISILESINELIETSKQAHKDLVNTISPSSATFANTLLPLAHAENALSSDRSDTADIPQRCVSRQRKASMNEDVFKMVNSVFVTAGQQSLDQESRNLLNKKHKEFVKNGLRIASGERRDRFKEIRSRIDALTSKYSKNLAEDNTAIYFAPDELEGFPEDILSELEKGQTGTENEGKLKIEIPMDLSSVLRAVKNPATRQKARLAYGKRCPANVAIFKEVVQLRHEAALLLGYPNHAALSVEDKMAATPDRVNSFLSSLRSKLTEAASKDVETLLRLKKADVEARGEDSDGHYFTWDNPYYDNMLLQQAYAVDQAKISEYFPLQSTVNGMLGIFEQLFALVCNFQHPSASKPTLLRHPDVVVLFLELGHGIHDLVSRTKFARFHGPMGTVVDFGEAPSQVLENWCWTPEQILSLSHHYSYLSEDYLNTWMPKMGKNEDVVQPPKALPRAMVESLLKAKHANKALDTLHQLFIGTFDMAVHQLNDRSEDQSFTALWNRLRREIVPTDDLSALGAGDEWGHGYTNIGHFMNEYEAGFYSYLL